MQKTRKHDIVRITKIGIVAALYFVLTVIIYPLSFGDIQIRFSEILLILCFFDKRYSYSLIIGCFCANLFSPMMLLDIVFGTIQTALACLLISYLRPLIVSLILCIGSMVIIGLELAVTMDMNLLWLYSLQVMIGEAIVLLVLAYPLSFLIKKSKVLLDIIDLENGVK